MEVSVIEKENGNIALFTSEDILLRDTQDILDLMAEVYYNHGCEKIILMKKNVTEDFFELKNRLAGDIMQKVINHGMSMAIVGDFDQYDSKSLKSLIYESNQGKRILFKGTVEEAVSAF
ncbi:MAG TPA: DUF4180 domain-containing protein [Clostridiaceae bacterium]|nr:DUF4180 domain-containing protein [Clostridiaceae bacterium]